MVGMPDKIAGHGVADFRRAASAGLRAAAARRGARPGARLAPLSGGWRAQTSRESFQGNHAVGLPQNCAAHTLQFSTRANPPPRPT